MHTKLVIQFLMAGVTTVWHVSHMLFMVVAHDIACKIHCMVVYMHTRLTANRILKDFLKKGTYT
jgi:hypothetical protein